MTAISVCRCPVASTSARVCSTNALADGLCVDACNTGVMDKMQYPRGLIRYSTQNGVAKHWTQSQMLRRVLRPAC